MQRFGKYQFADLHQRMRCYYYITQLNELEEKAESPMFTEYS